MRPGLRTALPLLLLFVTALPLPGQLTTGAITGDVSHDGVALPGVTITLASPALQGVRVAYSSINGDYLVPSIPPGDYTVSFVMEGMTSQVVKVTIGLARTERVDAQMVLAPVAESISVTAAATTVLETTAVQSNHTAESVDALPIARSIQSVAALAPAVAATNVGTFGVGRSDVLLLSGAPYYDSLYLVNGAVTNDSTSGQTENLFIEDAIQETSVIVGAISAEHGRFTGGVVSTITKSGGNEFSGSLRDSFTNPSWQSESALGEASAGSQLGETYESTLGGRIVRDRLWFFTAGRHAGTSSAGFYLGSVIPRPASEVTDLRYEVKLTGQPSPSHSLTASYFDYDLSSTNVCMFDNCIEPSAVDASQSTSRMAAALRYGGALTNNLFVESLWSSRKLNEHGVGGDHRTTDFSDPRDIALGSPGMDATLFGVWGAPFGCGACPGKTQENEYLSVKGSWFLASERTGTHNLVLGYEKFLEAVDHDYRSSASEFSFIAWSFPPEREEDGTLRPVINPGDTIVWMPIAIASRGSRLLTDSLFVNDKWDLGPKWSLNVGIRYDRNDATDRAGKPLSSDHNVSPRIGLIHDARGDGRLRVVASYSQYVSKMWETMGYMTGSAGMTSFYYYDYAGPSVGGRGTGLGSFDVMAEVLRWFLANGGTGNSDLLQSAYIPGVNTRRSELESPNVVEWSVGLGMALGSRGYVRIDAMDREWHDAYSASTSIGDVVEDPISPGTYLDVLTYANSEALRRTYQGVTFQTSYRATPRVSAGGNYTWSRSRGNDEGGEWPDLISPLTYPEYQSRKTNPIGYLASDQTHKGRFWIHYAPPLVRYGTTNLSILQRYESGRPYSAVTMLDVSSYVENPGYAMPPSNGRYYLSDRGAYRWQAASATDVAISYESRLGKARVFVQGDVINLFNQQAQIGGDTTVIPLEPFDPFTETPAECPRGEADCTGYNWQKGESFGKATMSSHYQLPRTYRFSAGLRF